MVEKRSFKKSLRVKFLVIMCLIVAVSGIISGIAVVNNNHKLLDDFLRSRGNSLGNYISGISADYLVSKDYMQLDNIVKEINKDPEVAYALVKDSEGNLVTSFFSSLNFNMSRVRRVVDSLSKTSGLLEIISEVKKDEMIIEVSTPVLFGNKTAGNVIIGISMVKVHQQNYKNLFFIIIANFLAFFIAILLLLPFQNTFVKPIINLAGLMALVSQKKDYTLRSSVRGNDELGHLARGFNEMLEQINLRDKELQVYRKSLENEVFKRTAELVRVNNELQIDLVKRKIAEDELRRINQQLKDTEGQLIQSSKMAAVGQLAGGVAHEINNPLTGVLNNVQLIWMIMEMKKEFNIEDFRELLTAIENSAIRCKKITQSLLDFSYASKGKFEPVSLSVLAQEVYDLLQIEFKLQNISIVLDLEDGLPGVLGDSQLLRQVIFGMMVNAGWAIQKKSKAGGTITLKTWHEIESRNIYFSISDNGVGISGDHISKLFEPFFTTKDIGEGTGLGLALAYSIIKSHMGDIKVESELGKGTTFTIILPLEKS